MKTLSGQVFAHYTSVPNAVAERVLKNSLKKLLLKSFSFFMLSFLPSSQLRLLLILFQTASFLWGPIPPYSQYFWLQSLTSSKNYIPRCSTLNHLYLLILVLSRFTNNRLRTHPSWNIRDLSIAHWKYPPMEDFQKHYQANRSLCISWNYK